MEPNPKFSNMPKLFWATVRTVSEKIGYVVRKENTVRVVTFEELKEVFQTLGLNLNMVIENGAPTQLANSLIEYYDYRANVLNNFVERKLMDVNKAREEFERLYDELKPSCPLPMNKQKGDKKAPAYLTGIINMLVEANIAGTLCDYDPRTLTTITKNGAPLRTLARRVDGAFPSVINPTAIWEVKEYYYTTTFGSRVADGIYETLLDGMELEELLRNEHIKVLHYLMIDAYHTWWNCGKSYLCRIIDMLHMGYISEALFGYEVVERLPQLVKQWGKIEKNRDC